MTRGGVVFAFDDGRTGTDSAYSVLHPAGIKATIPLNPGLMAGGLASDGVTPLITWTQVDTFVAGGWEATNHSNTHPDLTTLSNAQIDSEIATARAAIIARGYPTAGHNHFVVPNHATNATIRSIAWTYSVSCRDTSTTNQAMAVPMPLATRQSLKSRLFDVSDMQGSYDMIDAAVGGAGIAFIHTHGGDTNYWGQMRDFIVSRGYEGDCYTMTGLYDRYEWLWDRKQPLLNAHEKAVRLATGLAS